MTSMYRTITGAILALWMTLGASPGFSIVWPEDPALVSQAKTFLERLDDGAYEDAWQDGSALFQAFNPFPAWLSRQDALRKAYGKVIDRKLRLVDLRTTYRHSPDGSYAIIQFDSSFSDKTQVVETVILDCHALSSCRIREYILQ